LTIRSSDSFLFQALAEFILQAIAQHAREWTGQGSEIQSTAGDEHQCDPASQTSTRPQGLSHLDTVNLRPWNGAASKPAPNAQVSWSYL
jgi:hypothetical protein